MQALSFFYIEDTKLVLADLEDTWWYVYDHRYVRHTVYVFWILSAIKIQHLHTLNRWEEDSVIKLIKAYTENGNYNATAGYA